jgi:hypothetical protein
VLFAEPPFKFARETTRIMYPIKKSNTYPSLTLNPVKVKIVLAFPHHYPIETHSQP